MAFWVDKHRPKDLAKLDYHKEMAARLKQLVAAGDFPHLLIYGPSGAGKRTRIQCTLQELYGPGAAKLRLDRSSFEAPSGKKLEINLICSNYHIIMTPSDVGIYDRVVVQEVIKNMAQTQPLESHAQKRFKVIVLLEVDKLTREAQHALRRTMEKYSSVCRLILCCQSISKVIPPVQSRCLPIRVAAPSNEEIAVILQQVAKKEDNPITEHDAMTIAEKTGGNLRRAVLALETFCVHKNNVSIDKAPLEPDWELFVKETASVILLEQSPNALMEVRGRLYELLAHCIPPTLILKRLYFHLLHSCDASIKRAVTEAVGDCDYNLSVGSKAIFHLEAFVARFMSIYKRFLEGALGDFN
ncbi:replication factor C subunit 3 [Trichuris trichiura]|uniref:Replication factor C subunit 3 n=1 Tax=Trichuris trichiura TaxID=36087 RepID=A0A077YYG5_TRITR|nr:replication factor C subunit 3 [Trichuris trichiura]